jgi:Rap1a immunity proteins
MKAMAVALVVLMACEVHASAQAMRTGNDLKDVCNIAARGPKGEGLELAKATFCQGFVTALLVVGRSLEEPHTFCVPVGVTVGQAIDVVLKYMNDHPSELHRPAEYFVVAAFRDAWRCQ